MKSESSSKKTSDRLEVARKRFKLAEDAESKIRNEALEDLKFRSGEQWPEDMKRLRELENRPCLTVNRLPQFIRQVTNDQRQNRPSIKVSPVDDVADPETAKVLQGLIRHIEYNSNADTAYDTAFEGAVTHGFGFIRVVTDYVGPTSFDQEIKIKRVRNPFSIYLDPFYQEPDGSDAQWGFAFEMMSRDAFKEEYPKADLSKMEDWKSIGDNYGDWINEDAVRIAEYFYKEYELKKIVRLSNGQIMAKDELPEMLPEEILIEDERDAKVPIVHHCKINGIEILEETTWPGEWIPIIPVLGDELYIDGERILEGVIRHAKDPQRMHNFWVTSETETIALAPKAPWIGVEGQFEGYEKQWATANVRNHAFLQYKPVSISGQPVAPPQRNVYEAPVQAITNARLQSSEDLKATTGIYDAALGARSNENSGVAIQRRSLQTQTSNFHFVDNLSRSLRHLGRVLIDLIPKIYDTPRTVRIIGEDETKDQVVINQIFTKNGKEISYDLGAGKYDVAVAVGPSYATKRQEAVEAMLGLTQSYPQAAQFAGDLMIKNMDWPGADEIAERLKRTIPPEILGQDKKDGEEPLPPQVQQQMMQMNQVIQQLTDELNKKSQYIEKDQGKYEFEKYKVDKNAELTLAKIEADMRIALLKEEAATNHAAFEAEIAQLDQRQSYMQSQLMHEESEEPSQEYQEQVNPTGGPSPGQPMEQ